MARKMRRADESQPHDYVRGSDFSCSQKDGMQIRLCLRAAEYCRAKRTGHTANGALPKIAEACHLCQVSTASVHARCLVNTLQNMPEAGRLPGRNQRKSIQEAGLALRWSTLSLFDLCICAIVHLVRGLY